MAAKIGILGEDTGVAVATVTVYTVPADKAARVKILFAVENSSNQVHYNVMVGTPGSEIQLHAVLAGGIDFWTGTTRQTDGGDPNASLKIADGGVMMKAGIVLDTANNGYEYLIYPLPMDYYLSTGDTVRYEIVTNSIDDHLIQVVGVEDDA